MILSLIFIIPFVINILVLIIYIYSSKSKYKNLFIITAYAAFCLLLSLIIIGRFSKVVDENIDYTTLFWLFSGYLTIVAILVKILVFIRIYQRYQDPNNFHYNFFGKKVLHSGFLTNKEFKEFMITTPLFLFAGAYFVARLVNLILYGHLMVWFLFFNLQ